MVSCGATQSYSFNDGLTDAQEANIGSDPTNPDTDGDGLTDLDQNGLLFYNAAINATPKPSPDGQFIIFASDRNSVGSFLIELFMMEIDGSNPAPLSYEFNGPTGTEVDADPHWGPNNQITFKREDTGDISRYSRVYTATIGPITRTLSDVTLRTNNSDEKLIGPAAGDAIDIFVFDLTIQMSPFSVTATGSNITAGDGWIETMPSWSTVPSQPDALVYSASR